MIDVVVIVVEHVFWAVVGNPELLNAGVALLLAAAFLLAVRRVA